MPKRLPSKSERSTKLPRRPAKYRSLGRASGEAMADDGDAAIELLDPVSVESQPRVGRSRTTVFPTPPAKKMQWKSGVEYWRKVWDDPTCRARLKVYIYRLFPVMEEGGHQVAILSGSPDAEAEGLAKPMTIDDILHRYGSGDYSFYVNDMGVSQNQNVARIFLTGHSEMRQWKDYPPILDLAMVDAEDRANASFLKVAKTSAHYQSDGKETDAMQRKLEELQSRLDHAKDESHERELERMREELNKTRSADSASVDLVTYASKAAIDVMKRETASASPGQQIDPVAMMGQMMQMIGQVMAHNKGDDRSDELREARAEANQARAEQMAMVTKMLEKLADASSSKEPPEQPKSLVDQANELKAVNDAVKSIAGRSGGSSEPESPWMSMMPLLLQTVGPLVQAGTAWLLQNAGQPQAAQAQLQQGAPQGGQGVGHLPQQQAIPQGNAEAPPGMAVGAAGAFPAPQGSPTTLQTTATPQGAPTDNAEAPGGDEVTPEAVAEAGLPPEFASPEGIYEFISALQAPMIRFFEDPDQSGSDFADWYVLWKGQEHYEQLTKFEPAQLMAIMGQHPIWQYFGPRQNALERFLGEFYSDPEGDEEERDSADAVEDSKEDLAEASAELTEAVGAVVDQVGVVDVKPEEASSKTPRKSSKKVAKKASARKRSKAA